MGALFGANLALIYALGDEKITGCHQDKDGHNFIAL